MPAKLEKCRQLQLWAEKDPKKFYEAQQAWDRLRLSLQPVRKKYPAQFYEVSYSEAECIQYGAQRLLDVGKKPAEAAEAAKEGQKILQYNLSTDPKLDGPDRVEKYRKLITQLRALQGIVEDPREAVPRGRQRCPGKTLDLSDFSVTGNLGRRSVGVAWRRGPPAAPIAAPASPIRRPSSG